MRALRSSPCALRGLAAVLIAMCPALCASAAHAQADRKPNILVIMGDHIGWFNPILR